MAPARPRGSGRWGRPSGAAPAAARTFPPLWDEPKDYERSAPSPLGRIDARIARGPFKGSWPSLEGYRVPAWFRDAKFGIFIHWGVFSVPAFDNEWYSRNMYVRGSLPYEYHRAVYGPQSKFGYKDFIPRFTMAKFDPDAWADLFVRAGARYSCRSRSTPTASPCMTRSSRSGMRHAWDRSAMWSRLWRRRCAPAGCDSAFRRIAPSTGGGITRARSTAPTSTTLVTQASTDPRSPWICRQTTPRGSRTPATWSVGCRRRSLTSRTGWPAVRSWWTITTPTSSISTGGSISRRSHRI